MKHYQPIKYELLEKFAIRRALTKIQIQGVDKSLKKYLTSIEEKPQLEIVFWLILLVEIEWLFVCYVFNQK